MSKYVSIDSRLEELKQMHSDEANTLVRDLKIRLLEPVKSISKKGRPITFMAWEYMSPDSEHQDWKTRKSPMYSDETKLILENGPYDTDAVYRVTAHKDDSDFWVWNKIEKINDSNSQQQGEIS